MGCVVNGPGEARDADLGIAAGKGRGHLFVKGVNVAVVPEDEMVDALVEWAEFIGEHGVEAAQQRAEATSAGRARRAADADRAALARRAGRRRQPLRAAGRADPLAGAALSRSRGLRPRTHRRPAPWRSPNKRSRPPGLAPLSLPMS